jgi:hypothetical protein
MICSCVVCRASYLGRGWVARGYVGGGWWSWALGSAHAWPDVCTPVCSMGRRGASPPRPCTPTGLQGLLTRRWSLSGGRGGRGGRGGETGHVGRGSLSGFDLICNAQRRVSTRPSHAPASSRHVECTCSLIPIIPSGQAGEPGRRDVGGGWWSRALRRAHAWPRGAAARAFVCLLHGPTHPPCSRVAHARSFSGGQQGAMGCLLV